MNTTSGRTLITRATILALYMATGLIMLVAGMSGSFQYALWLGGLAATVVATLIALNDYRKDEIEAARRRTKAWRELEAALNRGDYDAAQAAAKITGNQRVIEITNSLVEITEKMRRQDEHLAALEKNTSALENSMDQLISQPTGDDEAPYHTIGLSRLY